MYALMMMMAALNFLVVVGSTLRHWRVVVASSFFNFIVDDDFKPSY